MGGRTEVNSKAGEIPPNYKKNKQNNLLKFVQYAD